VEGGVVRHLRRRARWCRRSRAGRAPRVPQLREAVDEQDRRPVVLVAAGLRHVHRDAVRLHRPVSYRSLHGDN
jgi:hypothetical protein